MQPDRRLVFAVTDDADHLFVSEVAAAVDEFSEKRGSDSKVPCGLCHIDGILDRGVIGLSFTERSRIGVAQNDGRLILAHRHDVRGVPLGNVVKAPLHFLNGRGFKFKASRAVQHVITVNSRDLFHIGFRGRADGKSPAHRCLPKCSKITEGRNVAQCPFFRFRNVAFPAFRLTD